MPAYTIGLYAGAVPLSPYLRAARIGRRPGSMVTAPGPLSLPHGHGTGSATDTDAEKEKAYNHICLASLHVHKWFGNSKRRLNDYTYIKYRVLLCLRKSRFVYNSHDIEYSGLSTLFLFLWILTPASIQVPSLEY